MSVYIKYEDLINNSEPCGSLEIDCDECSFYKSRRCTLEDWLNSLPKYEIAIRNI